MLTNFGTGIGESQNIAATAAAPGATTAVAALAGLVVGGVYRVTGVVALTGTAETALINLRLRSNGAAVPGGGILPSLSGLVVPFSFDRVTVLTGGALDVATQAAATAGSVYTVQLLATRIE